MSGQLLQFNQGDESSCYTITINQDQICENLPNEVFFSIMALSDGTQSVTVVRERATVVIGDSLESECGTYLCAYMSCCPKCITESVDST